LSSLWLGGTRAAVTGGVMKNGRNAAIVATIAGALSVPLAIGWGAARADELSDLRTNQELLQQRLDQLAQAQVPGNLFGVGGAKGPVGVQTVGGSFPRSFLIPGTDTSIRVGGTITVNVMYFFEGGNPNQTTASTTNFGNNGALNSAPLHVHNGAPVAGIFPRPATHRARAAIA
jgi:hypothetical protein